MLFDEGSVVFGVVAFARQVELAADHEGGVEVFLGEVETAGADHEDAVVVIEGEFAQVPVHQGAEAVVLDLGALGLAGGAGGVDDVDGVVGLVAGVKRGVGLLVDEGSIAIQTQGGPAGGQQGQEALPGEEEAGGGIVQHEHQPASGITGVERDVGSAGFEDAQQADDEIEAARTAQANTLTGAGTEGTQLMGQTVAAPVELGVAEGVLAGGRRIAATFVAIVTIAIIAIGNHGDGGRGAPRLSGDVVDDEERLRAGLRTGVEGGEKLARLGRGQQR